SGADGFSRSRLRQRLRKMKTEDQAARRLEELATAHVADGVHARSFAFVPASFAARLIGVGMRGYVAQRQMLPLMAASMSASLGAGMAVSSAVAAIPWPDWQ